MNEPKLSIIVVVFDMQREAPRTLFTLSPRYQRLVGVADYEVIVVDNGSPEPLGEERVTSFGPNFSYMYVEDASVSPVAAISQAVEQCRGEYLSIAIDGARMLTPGVVSKLIAGCRMFDRPIVLTLAYHLGAEAQQSSIAKGYNQEAEDRLLDSIDWQSDGYQLYEISTLALSSAAGLCAVPAESNMFALKKSDYLQIGGMDERFESPGGGLVNLDILREVLESNDFQLVTLLDEASFHQVHGGVSTNSPHGQKRNEVHEGFFLEYKGIRGKEYAPPRYSGGLYLGELRREITPLLEQWLDEKGKS